MRKEYDFSAARKNPYAAQLKKQITIRLDEDSIAYFKPISENIGIPYQSLINLYLRDCAAVRRTLDLNWRARMSRDGCPARRMDTQSVIRHVARCGDGG